VRPIRELLTTHGLARIADSIEAAARPFVLLTSGEKSEDPCSRLGGKPNLPEEVSWPAWRDHALPFVAQLDLITIPQGHGLSLPPDGSLYFFYEGGDDAWGFRPEDKGSAQVIYLPSRLSNYAPRALPDDIPEEMRFTGVRLEPALSDLSLPDGQDQVIDRLNLTKEEHRKYWEFVEAWREQRSLTSHRIGGYPEPIQGDPKLDAQLVSHGLYCGDASGFSRGKELGLWQGATDWELLLQVDSDERAGMMWGDVGRLYFLIRGQDLALRAFEKAWLVFQCS
jgi:uncharacterized protein YwqG